MWLLFLTLTFFPQSEVHIKKKIASWVAIIVFHPLQIEQRAPT